MASFGLSLNRAENRVDLSTHNRVERFAHRVLGAGLHGTRRVTRWLRKESASLPEAPRRILIIKLDGLGDLLCASPALQLLRQRYPDAHLTLLASASVESLYRADAIAHETWTWDCAGLRALPRAVRQFSQRCAAAPFDLAINLEHLSELGTLLLHASGAPATVGFHRRGEKRGLTLPVPYEADLPVVERLARLPRALGLGQDVPVPPVLAPRLTTAELETARETLAKWGVDEHTHLVGLTMDAHEEPTRRAWPPEKYVLLAQGLEETGGYKTVFLASAEEERFVYRHVKQMVAPTINLSGRTSLRQFAALLTHMHLLITSATGPLHLAAALGVPALGILRPEKAVLRAPAESERVALVVRDADPAKEVALDDVRRVMNDLLDHLADPEEPPWMSGR